MNFVNNQNLHLGISEKKDGPMKYSLESRLLFFRNNKLDDKIIVSAGLAHENKVVIVEDINESQIIPNCDALITNQNKYLLTVTISDCVPIYFYDSYKKVVALAHAGWRGVISEITKEVINKFISHYDSKPSDIEVFIGPHIKDCHFEVKDDVASQFNADDIVVKGDKKYINLAQVIGNQLIASGVSKISISPDCTYCLADKYFSYRRDNPLEVEAMIAYLGLK
ncbi:MAG: peptidoglycan editing factor PgeF [Patescibacteria group bacterium]